MPTLPQETKVRSGERVDNLPVPLAPTAAQALRNYFSLWATKDESLQKYINTDKSYVTKEEIEAA